MKDDSIYIYPNDTVAIICTVTKSIGDSYYISTDDVAIGSVDDDVFTCVDDNSVYDSLEANINNLKEGKKYYCFNKSLDDLRSLYGQDNYEVYNTTSYFMYRYMTDIHDLYNIIKKDKNGCYHIHSIPVESVDKNTGDPIQTLNDYNNPPVPVDEFKKFNATYYMQELNPNFDPLKDRVNLLDFYNYLKARILGNDEILKQISKQICFNLNADSPTDVKNILSIGPTGSGKSQTFKEIGKYLSIPVVFCDSTLLSAAGYYGDDVTDFLKKVYFAANKKIDVANKAILVLDEIDKLRKSELEMKEAAQDALLKVIEGSVFNVDIDKSRGASIQLDTTGMTIVGLGAFSSIFKNRTMEGFKEPTGFYSNSQLALLKKEYEDKIASYNPYEVSSQELIDYGFKNEFIPRFHSSNVFKPMDRDGIRRAFVEGLNSPLLRKVKIYERLYNTILIFDYSFVDALTEAAYKLNCGGRALDNVCELAFSQSEFDMYILNYNNPNKKLTLKVTGKTVENPKNFDLY